MSPAVPDRLRVTVAASRRRLDAVVPAHVPVAELLPELARAVGVLEPGTAHLGLRLTTLAGRLLAAEADLRAQGVEDGDVLVLTTGLPEAPAKVYDDAVEAVVEAMAGVAPEWGPEAGRRTALGGAVAALLLAGAAAGVSGSRVEGFAAGVAAPAFVLAATAVARLRDDRVTPVWLTWVGSAYAVVAGWHLGGGGGGGWGATYAGVGALLLGLLALLGRGIGWAAVLPVSVTGALLLVAGILQVATGLPAAVVLAGVLVVLVASGQALPWVALATTGRLHGPAPAAGSGVRVAAVDEQAVARETRQALQVLLGLLAPLGLLLVVASPFLVRLGGAGVVLALMCCALVFLQTRSHPAPQVVATGRVSAVLGVVAVGISTLAFHPAWSPGVSGGVLLLGLAWLLQILAPTRHSVRAQRLGDLAEGSLLVALLPTWLVAVGVVARVGG